MPIYEFKCVNCGHTLEKILDANSEETISQVCEKCGHILRLKPSIPAPVHMSADPNYKPIIHVPHGSYPTTVTKRQDRIDPAYAFRTSNYDKTP